MMQKRNLIGMQDVSRDARQLAIFNKMPFTGHDNSLAFARILDCLAEPGSVDRRAIIDKFDKYGGVANISRFMPPDAVFRVWASVTKDLGYESFSKIFALLAIEEEVVRFGPEIASTGKLAAKYYLSEDEVKAAKEKGIHTLYMSRFESEMGFANKYLPSADHYEKPLKLAESHLSSKEVQRAAFGMLTGHIFGGEFHDAEAITLDYSFSEENVKAAAIIALRRFMGAHPRDNDRQEKIASTYGLSEKEMRDCAAKACKTLIQNYCSQSEETEEFVERHRLYGNRELTGKLHWARIERCESLIRRGFYDEAQKVAQMIEEEQNHAPYHLAIIQVLNE